MRLKGNRWYFPLSIAAVAAILIAIIAIAAPELYSRMASNFWTFFSLSSQISPIIELEGWSIARAWSSFNFGLILMVGGLAALILLVIRKNRTDHLFVLVWSIVILVATILHVRYEYLAAVIVALASAFAVGFIFDYAGRQGVPGIDGASNRSQGEDTAKGKKKGQKVTGKTKEDRSPGRGANAASEKAKGLFYITCAVLLLFAIVSVYGDYQSGQDTGTAVIPDNWVDVLGVDERSYP